MTGTPPSEFMDDPVMYAAFHSQARAASWTDLHELLAMNAEISHATLCQLRANAGAKEQELPQPLRIRRPGDKGPEAINPLAAAMQMRGK